MLANEEHYLEDKRIYLDCRLYCSLRIHKTVLSNGLGAKISSSAIQSFTWLHLTTKAETTSAHSLLGGLSWDSQTLVFLGTCDRFIIEMSELAME